MKCIALVGAIVAALGALGTWGCGERGHRVQTPADPVPTGPSTVTPSQAPPHAAMTEPPPPPADHPVPPAAERRFRVFDGSTLILELSDRPGPIRSTAHGGAPARHRFLSGSARSAAHEDRLRTLLVAASTFDEFVASLSRAGFRLEPVAP
ncbi:MAG: hypothetical protein WKG01_28530 [Kofleriaceae bacterium]